MAFAPGFGARAVAAAAAVLLAAGPAAALSGHASTVASGAPQAQGKGPAKPAQLDKQQQALLEALVKLADEAMTGQPVPNDVPLHFRPDFLKAAENRTYVPFTLTLDASKLSTPAVALYLRVAPKGTASPAPAPSDKDKDKKKKESESLPANYPFEDVHYLDVAPAAGHPARIARAFDVPAGDYDVYFVLRERTAPQGTVPKASVLKQTINVPNFWTNELMTSSVMLADRVDTLPAPLPREQRLEHPYAIGQSDIQVAADGKFRKNGELSVIFLIYNPAVAADKTFNLQVDYAFYRKTPEGEKYFNRTDPQKLTPAMFGPQFDLAAGHQLVAGQEGVALAGFPEGDYRLEIKVMDLVSGKSITRDVAFTVTS